MTIRENFAPGHNSTKFVTLLLTIIAINVSLISSVQAADWHLWRQGKDLSVSYQQDKQTGINRLKATVIASSSLSGFLLFLQDTPNIPNWLDNAQKSRIIKQISAQENIFITYFNAIWPVKARNMVLHSRYWQNSDLSIDIAVDDAGSGIDPLPNNIRMTLLSGHWHIVPLPGQRISIEYQVQVDPNGNIPHWLVNKLALKSMWLTLSRLQQQLPVASVQGEHLANIKELMPDKTAK